MGASGLSDKRISHDRRASRDGRMSYGRRNFPMLLSAVG
jgi:hypothetical protein